jgi:hypothetical protein
MSTSDLGIFIVFVLFGLEVLARLGGWLFTNWRKFQDLNDWYEEDDEGEAPPSV